MSKIKFFLVLLTGVALVNAAPTVSVSLGDSIRPVTHVGTGSLYGLTETLPSNIEKDLAPLKPNVFLNPARSGNGRQQPIGGAFLVSPRIANTTGKVQIRLADILPGWPYRWQNWNSWKQEVTSVVNDKKASAVQNFDGYEIWNEPNDTWKGSNNFNGDLWKPTYDLLRQLDPNERIIGPSFSFYHASRMEEFIKFCVQNNCLPDVISWHQWGSEGLVGAIENYRALEKKYNITPRAISINEYSSSIHEEEGCPGVSVPFLAKFERHGVESAMISWWFVPLPGRLGSLLTKNNERGGGWWLYKWYGDMSGYMTKVTPPNDKSDGVDGLAALDKKKGFASILVGGKMTGDVNVEIKGIPAEFGNTVNVEINEITWNDKDTPASPTVVSNKEVNVNGGSMNVTVNIRNPHYGYRIYITAIIPQEAYTNSEVHIPGKIELENYDIGGEGKAYSDKDEDNKGGEYRDDGVDVVKGGTGYAIGYTQEGEWLEYTINVKKAAKYAVSASYATSSENAGLRLFIDNNAITDDIIAPKGEDWETYNTIEAKTSELTEGAHVLKLEIVGNYINLDYLEFCEGETCKQEEPQSINFANNYKVDFNVLRTFGVFSVNGKLLKRIDAKNLQEAKEQVHMLMGGKSRYILRAIR